MGHLLSDVRCGAQIVVRPGEVEISQIRIDRGGPFVNI